MGHAHAPFEPDIFEVVVPETEAELDPNAHLWSTDRGRTANTQEYRREPEIAEESRADMESDAIQPPLDGANIQLIISTCSESTQLLSTGEAGVDCVIATEGESATLDLITCSTGGNQPKDDAEDGPSGGQNPDADDSTDLLLGSDLLTLS